MILLSIETTGAKASAALIDEQGTLTVQRSEETMNHLQHLIPMIDQLLSKCGKIIDDVSVIAVSEGPGSFTGIRIGMATAKALAQVLNVPVVSVPTLEAFAYSLPDYHGMVCPIFDAKRSQVYAGAYLLDEEGTCRRLMEDGAYDLEEYERLLKDAAKKAAELSENKSNTSGRTIAPVELTLFGDGIAPYGETIREAVEAWNNGTDSISQKDDLCPNIAVRIVEEDARYQDAASVARLALRLVSERREKSLFEIHPTYLRKAEAERKLEEAAGRSK